MRAKRKGRVNKTKPRILKQKTVRDAISILKESVKLAQYGLMSKASLQGGGIFFVEVEAYVKCPLFEKPVGIWMAMLDVMCTATRLLPQDEQSMRIKFWVGEDSHTMTTPISHIRKVIKITKGKRDSIDDKIIRDWVGRSKYERRLKARRL